MVRARGEPAHPLAQVVRAQGGVEALLERALGVGTLVRETHQPLIGAGAGDERGEADQDEATGTR